MKLIPTNTKSENGFFFFTLCSINLKLTSLSGTENVQLEFNLDPGDSICGVTFFTAA